MYTLRKLEIEEGKDSLVSIGYTTIGETLNLFDAFTDNQKVVNSLDEVVIGWQILLYSRSFGYHRTSKIKEIVSREPKKITFKTQTSLYELLKED